MKYCIEQFTVGCLPDGDGESECYDDFEEAYAELVERVTQENADVQASAWLGREFWQEAGKARYERGVQVWKVESYEEDSWNKVQGSRAR